MEPEQVSFERHDDSTDPNTLLFGDDPHEYADEPITGADSSRQRVHSRRQRREHRVRMRRRRQFVLIAAGAAAILVIAVGFYGIRSLLTPGDYKGDGTGSVIVQVHPNDGADAIASTLVADGVVKTSRAFTNAAAANPASQSIGPGFYRLRHHMSAVAALQLLLTPSAHLVSKVTVPEGLIEADVVSRVATALHVSLASAKTAAAQVGNLGLPDEYQSLAGQQPASAEGFLFPATYDFDPGTTVAEALQQMTSAFTNEDRSIGFATDARKLKMAPYAALIIASIAQEEAKFPADMPKVARVILNRLASGMPLQIDATSAYAAKIAGLDPASVTYATIQSPFNTYQHSGLPPTPIGNPGQDALQAAVTPASGDWLYYVNSDAAGDLFFTSDPNAFAAAVAKCRANNWGCG